MPAPENISIEPTYPAHWVLTTGSLAEWLANPLPDDRTPDALIDARIVEICVTDRPGRAWVHVASVRELLDQEERRQPGEGAAAAMRRLHDLYDAGLTVREDADPAFRADVARMAAACAGAAESDCCAMALARRLCGGQVISADFTTWQAWLPLNLCYVRFIESHGPTPER